uniref:Vacuolar protein sorting 13 n=1 Tax=Mesembryanthemum crystallinum TaxID=3544 RepID=J7FHV5_MESCR|nr:vacuolar protein sorting 13 [Mesembryanthemum crystallinum]
MLEDQVAYLLQRYLGNYVRGLNKEALKISVWNGDVELTNMQLKPEALNALKLPIKVKAGFLGSVKLKVPWSRLGQDPVLVYLDRIFLLAEPATQVEGGSEDAVQEAKRNRIREMEMKLLERAQHLKTEEVNKSWLGSLINTIIGNLKLSISNIHIRYEDSESNIGHPFAVGVTLNKLSAFTVDDNGNETFATGGALDHIQKSVELERLALYFDSDISPWHLDKPWEDLLPSEWSQVFKFGTEDGKVANSTVYSHTYLLEPISGNAKYIKLRSDESLVSSQPSQKAAVNLDDVTICLPKDGYRDMMKLADNFAAFNQRLKYAHYRPLVPVKSDPRSWWKFAFTAVSDEMKRASGKLSWEQVLRYAKLRKKYISLYASLLKSDPSRAVIDDDKEIEELDGELDIHLIVQWRMVAHRFVEKAIESDLRKQREKKSWWSFGWGSDSSQAEAETLKFKEEDWERLNKIIGYKEDDDGEVVGAKKDVVHTAFEVYMRRNASKLIDGRQCVAELSCEHLECSGSLHQEAKTFDMKLGSYRLSSPLGLLAESATAHDSLVGTFVYKPIDVDVDWSMVAKASPCYMTYLKDSVDQILKFFEGTTVSHTLAVETAAAVQMTIDEMKRTAQEQMSRALKNQSRFVLDLDIAAPKITIPTEFCPDKSHSTKLMLDLGNLVIRKKDDDGSESSETKNLYLQFDMLLSDISAFLVDGDYHWSKASLDGHPGSKLSGTLLPVIDKCGVVLRLQQIKVESPLHPSTRVAVRVPSLGFHFSPARYHRLMQVVKIFEEDDDKNSDPSRPWSQADFEGWLSLLTWKGVANREAVWRQRYFCLVGPFLYILESPDSKSYKQYLSLRGKLLYKVPPEIFGNEENILAICDATNLHALSKVVEQANALILRFDSDDTESVWHSRLQSAIYRASTSAPITTLSESSSDAEDLENEADEHNGAINVTNMEKIFINGVLDELKICFIYSQQYDQSFMKMLLSEEKHLFEFRAIGGLVEIAIKENDMFIGTVLKSLEIEDLVCGGTSRRRYLARSFIRGPDVTLGFEDTVNRSNSNDLLSEGDDNFYEASENLPDTDSPMHSSGDFAPDVSAFKPPSFNRVPGLLPDNSFQSTTETMGQVDELDSFVKAQIVIYDQNSPFYSKTDKMVVVTLATLSFFCRRPTIAATMEFVNGINFESESSESVNDSSSTGTRLHDVSIEDVDQQHSTTGEQPVVKGLLGKGKSRIIFYLVLNMTRAQIILMKEDETKLATLSQDNLLTDIKVFPSSFSIKAAIGNLRIQDDSLPPQHSYFWACDMRNPGGSSFVEMHVFLQVVFSSYSLDDDDYEGYDYSLFGRLSEVRIVFLNRFVQEVVSYLTDLAPNASNGVVKLTDQVTDAEKWFTTSEIEGAPAVKLDLSLTKPIIVMPRRTDSLDCLELDVVHITVQNTFQWFNGSKLEMSAVHMEILTVLVEDINLKIGTGKQLGDSIIQDVNGLSIVIRRSLRDLLHQIPDTEATIEMDVLKAALSNREYEIITECALSNLSETPNIVPPLKWDKTTSPAATSEPAAALDSDPTAAQSNTTEVWMSMKVIVAVNLVELSLHKGGARDAPLATVQVNNAWLLYKSTTAGDGFLSVTLRSFNVLDDRESTQEQFRLAIGHPKSIEYSPSHFQNDEDQHTVNANVSKELDTTVVATMLILDAKFSEQSSSICLCVQRPQLLVALDFLLAVVEFFVPTVRGMLSSEEDDVSMNLVDAIILNESTYSQPSAEFSISPQRPLVIDNENFDHFIYDGNGGRLLLKDRHGSDISSPSTEAIIYVGNGKRLQFKNVHIKDGRFLDSCIVLGADSSYSVSEDNQVVLECAAEEPSPDSTENSEVTERQNIENDKFPECIIEFQAISPELTFYNTSKDAGDSLPLSNKLLHAQLDAFCRIILKGDTMEMTGNTLGLTMESNGIRILEPFDTSIKFSKVAGKTNIHFSASDIFMNFSFSILRLFLAVQEEMLAFLRVTSRKMTISCSEFDKVAMIEYPNSDQVYAFWRPRAPPGFAVLGDYLTPMDKPPTKAVLAVNMNLVKIKKPESFKLVWPLIASTDVSDSETTSRMPDIVQRDASCSIWFPVAPKGYIALGCVVSSGTAPPALSSSFCILASLVSSCPVRDCVMIGASNEHSAAMAFWRVDNCIGTFLPTDLTSKNLIRGAYDLRPIFFRLSEFSKGVSSSSGSHVSPSHEHLPAQSATANSGRRLEAVASFHLVWWNQSSTSRKKLSIWRPIVPQGMVYFGDIAVKGYEPPNTCVVVEDIGDELFKEPTDFQMVGKIKKHRGMEPVSFWLPQAPPGYVPLGCIACKGSPKENEFRSLRCIRSDMVTGDQFSDESVWDTYDAGLKIGPFSYMDSCGEWEPFGPKCQKKPSKRFAVKLADKSVTGGPEDTVIDAEISTFSAACFDDFGGLMVPLFNVSVSGIGFTLHGRPDYLNSTVSFSLAARSYNDKYESWEPVVEAVDGFLRYQYDLNSPGAESQLRLTSTKDLNLNVSSSNANMILQAYASWNNLNEVHDSYGRKEAVSPTSKGSPIDDVHNKRSYFIIPQNKLGQDIFIRATEARGLSRVIRMPSGDMKPLKVPVSKNMMDSHLRGNVEQKIHAMVSLIIAEAQFQRVQGLSSRQYAVAVRLSQEPMLSDGTLLNQQSARTCGCSSEFSSSSGLECVKWNEVFFFKVDCPESYRVELIVTDIGKGDPVGFFSAPLKHIVALESAYSHDYVNGWNWIDLSPPESKTMSEAENFKGSQGKLKLAVILSSKLQVEESKQSFIGDKKNGFIQISPTREGPWTTVRLNYATPAACWRLGSDVVASEVSVQDGNRYVNIRSLVSVRNETDFTLDLCLKGKALSESKKLLNDARTSEKSKMNGERIETVEFLEIEKHLPDGRWVCCSGKPSNGRSVTGMPDKEIAEIESVTGWEWVDDWHVDEASVGSTDGWDYAPDQQILKWSESCDAASSVNHVRQRRWVRNRRQISSDSWQHVSVGLLKPGDSVPLPLSCLTQAGPYVLQLRPLNFGSSDEYAWSKLVDKPVESQSSVTSGESGICVSDLEDLRNFALYADGGTSSNVPWNLVYLSVQAVEIAKDIRSDPIQDWNLVVKSPLSITNYLPLRVEYSVLEKHSSDNLVARSRGIFSPGKKVNVYSVDVTKSLFLSLIPQKGWVPMPEAVAITRSKGMSSRTLNLTSSTTERTVQVVLEHNHDKEQAMMPKAVRIYAPYWLAVSRCPALRFRLLGGDDRKTEKVHLPLKSRKNNLEISGQITEDEFHEGYTIVSSLDFKNVGLQASIAQSGEDSFGPIKDLSPLGDMDGSVELSAYDADGNCIRLFITSKPCPYQSIPTKVLSIRPYMTFTNRLGEDIFIKLSSRDEPKVLRASDSRVCFVYQETSESDKLQVRLADTKWSFPVKIEKEDSFSLVLRKENGERLFLKTEVRGYEEGSRFVVVFRPGSANGPIRIENRTSSKTISICQCGFDDDQWIHMIPLSTKNFSWDDPYGQKSVSVRVCSDSNVFTSTLNLETTTMCLLEGETGVQFQLVDTGDIKVARFTEELPSSLSSQDAQLVMSGNWGGFHMQRKVQNTVSPLELTIEFGVLGLSVVDHRPRELLYLYLDRVYIAYSTGYDGGTTSRFKLILGYLQVDNQLPLTVMPVLLAPEQTDMQQPVFKMTLTMRNENTDGIQVYPHVYIRVTDKCWRLNIHEPIIWSLMDFYNNLQLDRLPQSPMSHKLIQRYV